jgi:hypothetical protein
VLQSLVSRTLLSLQVPLDLEALAAAVAADAKEKEKDSSRSMPSSTSTQHNSAGSMARYPFFHSDFKLNYC